LTGKEAFDLRYQLNDFHQGNFNIVNYKPWTRLGGGDSLLGIRCLGSLRNAPGCKGDLGG